MTTVDLAKYPFEIAVDGAMIMAETLIVATGASAKLLGLESEKRLMGYGVSACATCDGAFFKDKEAVVVGGGDTALEEANFLTRFCSKVTVVHRRDTLRASKIMQDRARKHPKIGSSGIRSSRRFSANRRPASAACASRMSPPASSATFRTDAVFMAIGHHPNTTIFHGQLDMDELGYLIVRPGSTYTNVEGVFAAGDVADPIYRQAVTAAGTGCMAAIDAERWLEAREAGEA